MSISGPRDASREPRKRRVGEAASASDRAATVDEESGIVEVWPELPSRIIQFADVYHKSVRAIAWIMHLFNSSCSSTSEP